MCTRKVPIGFFLFLVCLGCDGSRPHAYSPWDIIKLCKLRSLDYHHGRIRQCEEGAAAFRYDHPRVTEKIKCRPYTPRETRRLCDEVTMEITGGLSKKSIKAFNRYARVYGFKVWKDYNAYQSNRRFSSTVSVYYRYMWRPTTDEELAQKRCGGVPHCDIDAYLSRRDLGQRDPPIIGF